MSATEPPVAAAPRLASVQMAHFVTDGYLRFDELAPAGLSAEILEAMRDPDFPPSLGPDPARGSGTPLDEVIGSWPAACEPVRRLLGLPAVRGIVESLVGPEPLYDHHAVHLTARGVRAADEWHADLVASRRRSFDIELLFFPAETPREMGGTMLLPGSHFRQVTGAEIGRYQNFQGQVATVCKAGTLVVMHHALWHCAQPNTTDRTRYMLKLVLNPSGPHHPAWDIADLDDPRVNEILQTTNHRWYGEELMLELVHRAELWRHLRGGGEDTTYLLRRLDEPPG
jgi:hypothetical protein